MSKNKKKMLCKHKFRNVIITLQIRKSLFNFLFQNAVSRFWCKIEFNTLTFISKFDRLTLKQPVYRILYEWALQANNKRVNIVADKYLATWRAPVTAAFSYVRSRFHDFLETGTFRVATERALYACKAHT